MYFLIIIEVFPGDQGFRLVYDFFELSSDDCTTIAKNDEN